jgi:hypothetical protein
MIGWQKNPALVLEIKDEVDAPVLLKILCLLSMVQTTRVTTRMDEDGDIPLLVNYMTDSEDESDDEQEVEASPVTTVNQKVICEVRKLSTLYIPEANVIAQQGRVTRSSVNMDNESGRDSMVTELANLLIDVAKVAGKV